MKQFSYLIGFSLILLTFAAVFAPARSYAGLFSGSTNEACSGVALNGSDPSTPCPDSSGELHDIVTAGINMFSLVVGLIAIIMIIIGGIKYITSSGEAANVNSAKNTILYAIIGLVVVALAQVIVRYVLKKVR